MTTTLAIGTRIKCGKDIFTILACGNGYYTVQIDGSKTRWTLRCEEAIADIASGIAVIL